MLGVELHGRVKANAIHLLSRAFKHAAVRDQCTVDEVSAAFLGSSNAASPRRRIQSKANVASRAMVKKMIPPSRWSLPVRNFGSTRVPSMAIVKMRRPFLATESGTAMQINNAFRHGERSRDRLL